MNRIKGTKLIFSAFVFLTAACLALPVRAQEAPAEQKALNIYDGKPDWYRAVFEKHVGLNEGSGPFKDFFKPTKLHMYWSPDRHYVPSDKLDHTIFIEKERKDLCVLCHEGINVGTVVDWQESAHYNPKKSPFFASRTRLIEKSLGREINQVHCFDCHVDKEKKSIRMPSANVCGECHTQQVEEFMQESKHGRPNHVQSWEANVIVPWYADMAQKGHIAGMVGCDMCHAVAEKCDGCHTRHTFSSVEARKSEACVSCHMGPDHPDSESYFESKHGKIYEMQEEHFDFTKPLAQVEVGKDYRAPTCQLCHMYQGGGRFTHNFVSKGIWRMGTVPPSNIEYESSLKDYPYGIKIIANKIDIYSDANNEKRAKWNELCSKCHGPRFVEAYRECIDDFMLQAFKLTDQAQKILDDLAADGMYYPSIADRDIFPLGDKITDILGPDFLGEPVFNALKTTRGKLPIIGPILGVYGLFYQGKGNPLPIENAYAKMWFFYKLQGYKGTAHAQQDLSWWWGQAPMLHELGVVQSEAARLRREAALEKTLAEVGGVQVPGGLTPEDVQFLKTKIEQLSAEVKALKKGK
ncbi:MAG TPA: multiheme c-type cytochrome [Candidatus Brocadiia bacterium]|nr:hydroxylamine oxidoreductase [Planctomycetota bacterium]MBI4007558.1 hydroxylamine oxidoreductase [Planctomycetota bacterium]MDO8094389.1 multiheme c-type cytochrome [Candidatus Brocadiales bacterium]